MINVHRDGPVAVITLARAEKRNALTPEILGSLVSAVQQVAATEAGAILLTGEGQAFCAGFDLSLCKDHPDGSVLRALLTGLADAIDADHRRPRVVRHRDLERWLERCVDRELREAERRAVDDRVRRRGGERAEVGVVVRRLLPRADDPSAREAPAFAGLPAERAV